MINSLSNPIAGSAAFDHGTKPGPYFISFSVGIKAVNDYDYIQKDINNSDVKVSIKNGIATFSHPQAHSYIGVGDIVTCDLDSFYLNEKISTTQWKVFKINAGSVQLPSDTTTQLTLSKIDKVYSGLQIAMSSLHTLLGTYDISSSSSTIKSSVRIACYQMSDTVTSTTLSIENWITSSDYYINIFSPYDIATQCNSNQRHSGISGSGYLLSSLIDGTAIVQLKCDYTVVDGLHIDATGRTNNSLIVFNSSTLNGCKITNNLLSNCFTAISNNSNSTNVNYIVGNIIYGISNTGMYLSTRQYVIYNNTIYGSGGSVTGIYCSGSGIAVIKNNLVQACSTCINATAADISYCITSDSSITGATNHPSTLVTFKDSSSNDFRLDLRSTDYAIKDGVSLSSDSLFSFSKDILNNAIDDTWSIGAVHYTRGLVTSIGPATNLMTGSPSVVISGSIMTFSVNQINTNLCSGCIVLLSDSSKHILIEIKSATSWLVSSYNTSAQGYPSADAGPLSVTSITPAFSDLHNAIDVEDAHSAPGIQRINNTSANFKTSDLKVTIYCVSGNDSRNATTNSALVFDSNRNLTIKTAADVGVDCVSSLRHKSFFNSSLWYMNSCSLQIYCNNVTVDGLQITGPSNGIRVTNGVDHIIKNNIVANCSENGISIESDKASSKLVIVNNLVYNCLQYGINIDEGNYTIHSYNYLYSNTVVKNYIGINIVSQPLSKFTNIVIGKNNLEQSSAEYGYFSTTYDPNYVSFNACWGSDLTLLNFKGNNKYSSSINFKDVNNYQIYLADSLLMDAEILSADPYYQFTKDNQYSPRGVTKWDIGCFSYLIDQSYIAHFSLGANTNDLQSLTGLSASVTSGILKFSNKQIGLNVGVGDKVTIGASNVYLSERGNAYTWAVRTNAGHIPSDIPSATVTSLKRVINSFSSFSSLSTEFGSLVVTGSCINVWCYADAVDTSSSTSISGWTCNSTSRIKISTPYNSHTQCNSNQRHNGTPGAGFQLAPVSGASAITINNPYIDFQGIVINANSAIAISMGSLSNGNIIKNNVIKTASYGISQIAGSNFLTIVNNIIFNSINGISIQYGYVYNNTVSASSLGVAALATSVFINNISIGSSACYDAVSTKTHCISSDSTAGVGTGCVNLATLNFEDPTNGDYHLNRSDIIALNRGFNLSSDIHYSFCDDIDNENLNLSTLNSWSIGADSIPDVEDVQLYFSCSENANDFKSGLSPTVIVNGGVATFNSDQTNKNIGIGDIINYDLPNKTCYLYKKIDDKNWQVRTKFGLIPNDNPESILNSIKHSFITLSSALSLNTFLANGLNNFVSFVDARYQINIPMYKSTTEQSAPITIANSYTTNLDYFLKIYTPIDIRNECNYSQRHTGWYDPDLNFSEGGAILFNGGITCNLNYTTIEGLIIDLSTSSLDGITIPATVDGVIINGNIVLNAFNGIRSDYVGSIGAAIINNIVQNSAGSGIICSDADFVANNTIVSSGLIGISNTSITTMFNNYVAYSMTSDFNDNSSIQYCWSSDYSAGSSNNCVSNASSIFENESNHNYNLSAHSPYDYIRCSGIPLNSNTTHSFSTDAVGLDRGPRWGIGALLSPSKKACYAVGSSALSVHTGINPNFIIDIQDATDGHYYLDKKSILIFSDTAQIDPGMGVGNEVICSKHFTNGCLIKEKITTKKWIVTDYNGDPILDIVGDQTVTKIGRTYNSLSTFLQNVWSDHSLSKDLVSQALELNAVCYNDSVNPDYSFPLSISNLTTSYNCRFKIYAPYDLISEVNSKQRHNGKFNNGYSIAPIGNNGLQISSVDYIKIEGLCISAPSINASGISINNCLNYEVVGNVITGCGVNGVNAISVMTSNTSDFIINNLIYGCKGSGVIAGSEDICDADNSFVNILNNTIVDCKRGIFFLRNGTSVAIPASIKNNICQQSYYQDFVLDWPEISGEIDCYYNVSSDYSTRLYGGITNYINDKINFVNISQDTFDLSFDDYSCINDAEDMALAAIPYWFNDDINLFERPYGEWDRGAFQLSDISGSGVLQVSSLSTSYTNISASNNNPLLIIHLRLVTDFIANLPIGAFQFSSINDVNTFLNNQTYFDSYNIQIYVEGGKQFAGKFSLRNRGSRSVVISTYPSEVTIGLTSLTYSDNLIDDTSKQASLTFEGLMIYPDNGTHGYLISDSGNSTNIKFIDCIVLNRSESILNISSCTIWAFGSIFIYRNSESSTNLYLCNNNSQGHILANSMIVSFFNSNLTFATSAYVGSLDKIFNTLTFNYDRPNQLNISNINKYNCLINTDPLFEEVSITSQLFTIAGVMNNEFQSITSSPIVDAGNNAYIMSTKDIVGNDRIFNYATVDIGPYELQINYLVLTSKNIASLFQSKLNISYKNKSYSTDTGNLILSNLYKKFEENMNYRDEFARESKIIVTLKSLDSDFSFYTDKTDVFVADFEAYYDSVAQVLVLAKQEELYGNLFTKIFGDGRFIFRFNEAKNKLSVYINDTFNKGASGDRNPIKNIKFGGPSLFIN